MIELPDDVRALVDAPNLAHIATTMPDGAPHAVAVWIATEGPHVVFLTGPYTQKAHNIGREPRVAFSVAENGNPYHVAAIRGRVVEVVDGERGWEIVDRISEKYTGGAYPRDQGDRVAYLVEPEHAQAFRFG